MDIKQAFEILGLEPTTTTTAEEVEKRFLQLAHELHPDHGGDKERMAALNEARSTVMGAFVLSKALVPMRLIVAGQEEQQLATQRIAKTQEVLRSRATGRDRQRRRVAGVFAAVAAAAVFAGEELPAEFLHTSLTDLRIERGISDFPISQEEQDALEVANRDISRLWLSVWFGIAAISGIAAWWLTKSIEKIEHDLMDLEEEIGTKTLLYRFLHAMLQDTLHQRWTIEELRDAVSVWQAADVGPYSEIVRFLGPLRFAQHLMDRAQQAGLVSVHEESEQGRFMEYYRVDRPQ